MTSAAVSQVTLADLDIPIPGQRAPPLLTRQRGPPMTPRSAAPAKVRLIVWRKACQHQVEPDPAEMGPRYRRKVCARMTRTADLFRRERSSGSAGRRETSARLRHLRHIGPAPQLKAPESGRY